MKLLIAEDHEPTARALIDLVRPWGYDPEVVPDGAAALQALRGGGAPQLALLDWLMPGLDGVEVCRQVRHDAARPYAYLILLTGRGGRESLLAGLGAGADDFLAKPVDADELQARLSAGRRVVLLQQRLLDAQRRLHEQATRDALTGLWNRGAVLDVLDRELARAAREGRPVAVILADLDHFKRVNDTHGHLGGDEVLRQAGRRMLAALRPYDLVGRYGGEEFLVVLPGCGARDAAALAGRLRRRMAAKPIDLCGAWVNVTLSLGVAACPAGTSAYELLRVADAALYRAKGAGRNRVRLGKGPGRAVASGDAPGGQALV